VGCFLGAPPEGGGGDEQAVSATAVTKRRITTNCQQLQQLDIRGGCHECSLFHSFAPILKPIPTPFLQPPFLHAFPFVVAAFFRLFFFLACS